MKKVKLLLVTITMIASYALTAQNGVAINTDGTAPDSSAMLDVESTVKGMLIPRMDSLQRSAIPSPATGLMIYQTDGTTGFYYYNDSEWTAVAGSGIHYAGELYGGGVVFWVDHTGQHGLIASMIDLSTSQQAWSNVTSTSIGSTAQSDWDGLSNSNAIVGQSGHTNSAAKFCLDYTNADYGTGQYSDWYLPSLGELNDLWNNLKVVQKALDSDGNGATTALLKQRYWSSSEYSNNTAWYFSFGNGNSYFYNKSMTYFVRAVRAF